MRSSAPARWSVNLLLAVFATSLTLLVIAGVGEITARRLESRRTTVPGTPSQYFYRHRRLGYAFVRNVGYHDWFHINAQGFRGVRNTDLDSHGAFRILAVGASTTFDSFVTSDEKAWPAVLGRDLTVQGRPIEVINAGVPGYVLWQNTVRLSTDLAQYRPDLLLLLHGHNELGDVLRRAVQPAGPSERPDEVARMPPGTTWLESHSALYRKLSSKWQAIRLVQAGRREAKHAALTPDEWQITIDQGALEYERELEAFVATARIYGIRVVLLEMVHVTDPSARDETDPALRNEWETTLPAAPVEVTLAAYREFNAVTRRVAERNRLPLIATTEFGVSGGRYYSAGDPIHFNV